MRPSFFIILTTLFISFIATQAPAQQHDGEILPSAMLRVNLREIASNPILPDPFPRGLLFPKSGTHNRYSPTMWNQPPGRTEPTKASSRAARLSVLLGGLALAAGGGFLISSAFEEKTIPGSCMYDPGQPPVIWPKSYCTPATTYTKYNTLKISGGTGLIGAGSFLIVKGLLMMRR